MWDPQSLQKIADILLHDVAPILYVAFWLIFVSKCALRWKSVLSWMIYPAIYLVYALVRGALSGRYPYPFLDASALGYPRVLSNAAMLVCAFVCISLLVVAITRWRARNPPSGNQQLS